MRIIYFDIDCLRPDHLGCYGYKRPTSPTIDAIAEQGIRFNNYYCASSPCLPSRTALVSGRFGIRNGVISNGGAGAIFNNGRIPDPKNEMFPRQLKAHGYDPICFSNFADHHYSMWFTCGWSEFHTPNLKGGLASAEEVNAKVMPWLKNNAARENYYLHINYWDTHQRYKIDPAWADRFKDYPVTQQWPDEEAIKAHQNISGRFTANGQAKDDENPAPLMPGNINTRRDFEKAITAYDSSISYVDHHIKEVLDELDRQGVLDDAVIIFSGDHGDAFGEHGIYCDHTNVDNCIHHIPLIIRWPGITPENTSSDAFMYNVDYAPTICDMLDIPGSKEWDGKSYKANVEGKDGEDRDFLVWNSGLYTVQRAVRTKKHLYIRTYDSSEYNNWKEEELYNMVDDIYETKNLVDECPETVQECRNIMDEWVQEQMKKNNWVSDPIDEILRERGISSKDFK